ncbi:carbohydrate-binding protein [Pseudoalteromonas aurantia]|uniref:carbohydrate-binding protein n=1 Tax=Pseudoalteromonas aurantia TaxID=43654 RepID=UPI0014865EEA|nr:carbohydrate-binding protein [Pseudoalteromonas aurantia]
MLSSSAFAAIDCAPLDKWQTNTVYTSGDQVQQENIAYQANWWNKTSRKLRSV